MTDFQETSSILENLYLVDVRVGFPCGTTSGSDDLVATSEKEVVRVGVQIFDPKLQRPFSKARQQVRRLCTSLGSAFLGGYAIPENHIEEFRREVGQISSRFATDREVFLDGLDAASMTWADSHPNLRDVILSSRVNREQAEKAFKFGVRMCQVVPPEPGSVADTQDNYLFQEVKGLGVQIAREIAQDVNDSWGGDVGAGRTTQKVVGLIRRCRKKAHGLAFVHGKVKTLVDTIDAVLTELPQSGPIDGIQYLKVVGLLRMLSDPRQILGDQQVIVDEPVTVPPQECGDLEGESDSASNEDNDSVEGGEGTPVIPLPASVKAPPSTVRVSWIF